MIAALISAIWLGILTSISPCPLAANIAAVSYISKNLSNKKSVAMSSILYLIDVFLVGLILKEGISVASYKTATLIPFALNFLPMSIIQFIYPYLAKNCNNMIYIKDLYIKILKIFFVLNSFIAIILFVSADFLLPFLFRSVYVDSKRQ